VPGRRKREESRHLEQSSRLSDAFRKARREQDLSQQELATRASVAIGTVRAVESGRVVEPGFFTVLALARVLGVDAVKAVRTDDSATDVR